MSVFKINLKPVEKERDYEVKYIRSGRKTKTCSVCQKGIPIGHPSTTFLKRKSVGMRTTYDSIHTCGGNARNPCTIAKAEELKVDLP